MLECLADGNRIWASNVPVLILSIAKPHSSYNNKPNVYAMHDTGMAVANLLVQATDMGLCVHQMGGYDREMAKRMLKIPDGYEPVAMIAVGYYGNIGDLPEDLQAREKAERKRLPLEMIVFRNSWQGG